jgi:uncharacterized membrane protein (DUF2068 family)
LQWKGITSHIGDDALIVGSSRRCGAIEVVKRERLVVGGVRAIAILEALKGILVLLAGFGLLSLLHRDLGEVAEHWLRITHINPDYHFARVFVEAAIRTDEARLKTIAAIAFAYSTLRFIEAYGLWNTRTWAEWFGIVSGSIYLPLEIIELYRKPTIIRASVLIINAIIVLYLIYVRWSNHKETMSKTA